jgi:hypothetical protein
MRRDWSSHDERNTKKEEEEARDTPQRKKGINPNSSMDRGRRGVDEGKLRSQEKDSRKLGSAHGPVTSVVHSALNSIGFPHVDPFWVICFVFCSPIEGDARLDYNFEFEVVK